MGIGKEGRVEGERKEERKGRKGKERKGEGG